MRKLSMLFLCLFFWCCNSQPEIAQVKLQAEELEVIKQTFTDSISSWQIIKMHNFLPSLKENQLKETTSGTYENQPNKIVWFVKDTLYNPSKLSPGNIYPHIPRINPRIKLDTIFYNLERKLYTNLYPKQAAKISGLIINNYIFKSIDSIPKLNRAPKRYFTFSRVIFNLNHTKACYYISKSYPENHSANGDILYVEKKHGMWYLIYRNLNWTT